MPTKAAYELLEFGGDVEFEFYLADRLHMTVAELRGRMSHQEFVTWGVYHQRIAQRKELENAKLRGGR